MADCKRDCALCKTGKHHRRTPACVLDPKVNPYRKWNDPLECDYCRGAHEPVSCKMPKAGRGNPCGNCGHGWHTKAECMLHADVPEELQQFTLSKYNREQHSQARLAAHNAGAASVTQAISTLTLDTLEERNLILNEKREKKQRDHAKWAESGREMTGFPGEAAKAGSTNVKANFHAVTIVNKDIDLRRYSLNFVTKDDCKVANADFKRTMILDMLSRDIPSSPHYATDYSLCIISVGALYQDCGDVKGTVINRSYNGDPGGKPQQVTISIRYEGKVLVDQLHRYVNQDTDDSGNRPDEDLKALNILSWKFIYESASFGRVGNKFYPMDPKYLTGGENGSDAQDFNVEQETGPIYQIRTGFFSSMRPAVGQLLLNVNATATAFFSCITVETWIHNYLGRSQLTSAIADDFARRKWKKSGLKGLKVIFKYDRVNPPKKWRICDISKFTVFQQVFTPESKPGEPSKQAISVWSHCKIEYKANSEKGAFCINVGSVDKVIWYPADLLEIVDWQVVSTKSGDLTQAMVRKAVRTPDINQDIIRTGALEPLGISLAAGRQKQHYADFGFQIASEFTPIKQLRVLPHPVLEFGNNAKTRCHLATWKISNAQNNGFYQKSIPYPILYIIKIGGDVKNSTDEFSGILCQTLWDYQLKTKSYTSQNVDARLFSPSQGVLAASRRVQVGDALTAAVMAMRKEAAIGSKRPTLIVVLLPNKRLKELQTYADVKWWGDCIAGIPTVCISSDGVGKVLGRNQQALGNIALKINFKLGNIGHRISEGKELGMQTGGTMIMGADVTHPGRCGDDGCPSMAGVVATCEANYMHYLPSARLQDSNTEFIADLGGMVVERLRAYFKRTDTLPANILFYRDGVSESQFGMVYEEEYPQVRKACEIIRDELGHDAKQPGWKPKITILVVGKRHHARFFPQDPEDARNLEAGLVVDKTVVHPKQTSFYLQSHHSAIGTARTGHYVVIANENNYTLDQLEEITNKICFTGSRATTALSVCTPARYADILCTRLRCYMHPVLNEGMSVSGKMLASMDQLHLDRYRQNGTIWVGTRQDLNTQQTKSISGNPWQSNLDDVMLYL